MPASWYPDWESFKFPVAEFPGEGAEPGDGTAAGENGPVAFCADLSPGGLLAAYRRGVVPLPAANEYLRTMNEVRYEDQVAAGTVAVVGDERADPYRAAWWSPDPRPVIGATSVHLGRNVRKRLRRDGLRTTANAAFRPVAEACRAGREPRWLTDELLAALIELNRAGWAHSIEVWLDDQLVGGAMGVGLGGVLSGDSLFGWHPGGAAVAVADMGARLAEAGGTIVDAQWDSPFLRSLGAEPVPRGRYLDLLGDATDPVALPGDSRPAKWLLG
jgi:leucyl/phenylalanyl-tRNA---protein transferase